MVNWQRIVNKALARNKRTVTYSTKSTASYDPTTGQSSVNTTNTAIDCARDFTKRTQSDGANIILVDKTVFYISPDSAVVPKANDTITDGTDKFTIDKVEKQFAGGALVLYIVYCNS